MSENPLDRLVMNLLTELQSSTQQEVKNHTISVCLAQLWVWRRLDNLFFLSDFYLVYHLILSFNFQERGSQKVKLRSAGHFSLMGLKLKKMCFSAFLKKAHAAFISFWFNPKTITFYFMSTSTLWFYFIRAPRSCNYEKTQNNRLSEECYSAASHDLVTDFLLFGPIRDNKSMNYVFLSSLKPNYNAG